METNCQRIRRQAIYRQCVVDGDGNVTPGRIVCFPIRRKGNHGVAKHRTNIKERLDSALDPPKVRNQSLTKPTDS